MENKRFYRNIEDFVCENCGREVKGNGFTDHCPFCLVSKHVDINPGDRKRACKGLMLPVSAIGKKRSLYIYYKCKKCGATKRVGAADGDDMDIVYKLIKVPSTLGLNVNKYKKPKYLKK